MIRLLLWLVLAFVGWSLWRSRRRVEPPPRRDTPPPAAEAMVDCARCGLHLPASEAVLDAQGRPYCGHEHRSAGPAPQ